jgi:hypothetical protein
MKTIEVSEEFYNFARGLANYVDTSDSEWDSLKEFIGEGNNPEDHILYIAAVVGGWEDSFQEFVDSINEEIEVDNYKTEKRISD